MGTLVGNLASVGTAFQAGMDCHRVEMGIRVEMGSSHRAVEQVVPEVSLVEMDLVVAVVD